MIPADAFDKWTFDGFVSTQPFANGNMLGSTGAAMALQALSGCYESNFVSALTRCQSGHPGMFRRTPDYTDFTPSDDYWLLLAGADLQGWIPPVYDYGWRHLWIFNTRQPGCPILWDRVLTKKPWEALAPLFARFISFIPHVYYYSGRKTNFVLRFFWRFSLYWSSRNTKSQMGWMNSWAMIQVYKYSRQKTPSEDAAVRRWWAQLDKFWPGGMRAVALSYIGIPDHPLVVYWDDYR